MTCGSLFFSPSKKSFAASSGVVETIFATPPCSRTVTIMDMIPFNKNCMVLPSFQALHSPWLLRSDLFYQTLPEKQSA